jgi:excisionase family DNA binding protein
MIEDAIRAAVAAAIAPLTTEIRELRSEVEALRTAVPPSLVNIEQAADKLGVSTKTVWRWCQRGEIRATRVGHRWMIDLASLRAHNADDVAAAARDARRAPGA